MRLCFVISAFGILNRRLALFPDRLGTVFSPVKSDIGGNIAKLKKAVSQNANKAITLQKLVLDEKAAGKHKDSNSSATSLLWFQRCAERIWCIVPVSAVD